jgi:hypothetical protein
MGWRDRDYAKFRKDEFEAIYGRANPDGSYATATSPGASPRISRRRRRRRGSSFFRALRLLAIAVVGAAVLLGGAIATGKVKDIDSLANRTPNSTPVVVVPQVPPPTPVEVPATHRTIRISGTRLLQYGGTLTLSGSHTPMVGNFVISGRWGAGHWETFAVARGDGPTYSVRIPLDRRGVLHIRINSPDGSRGVGTYQVR